MRILVVTLALSCGTVAACADEAAEPRVDVTLKNVRWQPFPAGFSQVIVGPDGRTWFQGRVSGPKMSLDELKRRLAAEYAQPSPQIRHARLLLIEPKGRAWFHVSTGNYLLGYDGTEWITHSIAKPTDTPMRMDIPMGRTPTRGGLFDGRGYRFAGGAVWFLTSRGVHRFDGKDWTSVELEPNTTRQIRQVYLAVSPDGALGAIGVEDSTSLRIFRDGRWSEQAIVNADKAERLLDLVARDAHTLWYRGLRGGLNKITVADDGHLSPPEEVREIGPFDDAKVLGLYQDERGRTFVVVARPDGRESPDAGVVIVEPNGAKRVLSGNEAALGWILRAFRFPPPILTSSGEQAWLPNRAQQRPAALFDFGKGQFVDAVPHADFGCLHAVDAAGRLFVARNNIGIDGQLIMVYTPDAAEIPTLHAKRIPIGEGGIALEESGAIWAHDPMKNLIRIVGEDQRIVRSADEARSQALLGGLKNVMLVVGEEEAALYQEGREVATGTLFQLLEDHRDVVCQAFGPDNPPPLREQLIVAADRQGRIWCLRRETLWVLVGNRWHDSLDALTKAGSRSGHVSYLASIGDGSGVFVSDLMLRHDGGRSFIGRLASDKPVFADADHVMRDYRGCYALRDHEGGLWLRVTEGRSQTTSDAITGQAAVRLLSGTNREAWRNIGWPKLVDRAGNVWLADVWGKPQDVLNVWRKGKVVQELHVPAYEAGGLLFSDRVGSVFARTPAGLQQLVADGPDGEYRLGPLWQLDEITGRSRAELFSSDGRLIIAAFSDLPRRTSYLHVVDVPSKGP